MDRHPRDIYESKQGSRRPEKTSGHEKKRPPIPPPAPRPPKPTKKATNNVTASHDLRGESGQVSQSWKDNGHEGGSESFYGSWSNQRLQSHEPYQRSPDSIIPESYSQGNYPPQSASDAQSQRRSNHNSNPSSQHYASNSLYSTGRRSAPSSYTSSSPGEYGSSPVYAPSSAFCRHGVPRSQQCTSCRLENDYV